MLIEGLTLLMKTSDRALRYSGSNRTKVRNQKLVFGWGFPALFVLIGIAIGFPTQTYMEKIPQYGYRKCWLNNNYAVYYVTVFGPLCLIYITNIIIFGKMLLFIYVMSKSSDKFTPVEKVERSQSVVAAVVNARHLKTTLKSFGLLFFVLGIPFLFSFLSGMLRRKPRSHCSLILVILKMCIDFSDLHLLHHISYLGFGNNEVSTIFMFLNVTFNGLQGLFLLIVYCGVGREVRKALRKNLERSMISSLLEMHSKTRTSELIPTMDMSSSR